MASLTFLDGNGISRSFEFNENASLYRFLIDTQEKVVIETIPSVTLTVAGTNQTYGLGNVKSLSLDMNLTGIGTNVVFAIQYSNDGGTTYRNLLPNITWLVNQAEVYTLDNTDTCFTNLRIALVSFLGGAPNLTLNMALLK